MAFSTPQGFSKVNGEWERIPTVELSKCEFSRRNLQLRLASEFVGMPREIIIRGVYNDAHFIPVPEGHKLFDPDQWDGEQMVYIPAPGTKCGWVRSLVIYHQY